MAPKLLEHALHFTDADSQKSGFGAAGVDVLGGGRAPGLLMTVVVPASFLRRSPTMTARGPLIGRERELVSLEQALYRSPLLTLTGAGGCGKTRVALELADRAARHAEPFESCVVELAIIRNPEQLAGAVLRSVGARERGGRKAIDLLVESLVGRQILLVLDNCEHLAPEVAALADVLLDSAPELRLMVTSREPLGIAREVVFSLPPLSIPETGGDVAAVVRSDAGCFFVDRAVAADPGFALTPSTAREVVRICRELDGLPLALSLAAARVDTLTPSEIADGLARHGRLSSPPSGDALPQHRSIHASLDWSQRLLDEQERVLLRRLASFAGGWTATAARAVALPEVSDTRVRALLGGLEAKGLIVGLPTLGEERWSFLQTVAAYETEQLSLDADEADVFDRHLAWFVSWAAEADRLLLDRNMCDLIEAETPNLRLALERALERDAAGALALVASLTRHWILAEHFDEGRDASTAALAVADDSDDAATRAVVHCGAGLICTLSEDYPAAIANTQASLALVAGIEDAETEARCRQMAGMVLILTGLDLPEGLRCVSRAVELLRSSEDLLGLAWALANVAMAAGVCDQFDAARAAYEEFRQIPGASEQARLRTWAELAAAWVELVVGSADQAVAHADLALALEGDWPSMTHFIARCHRVQGLALQGRSAQALQEGRQALSRAQESGAPMATAAIQLALVIAELMDGDLDASEAGARRLMQAPQIHTRVLLHEVLAQIALARGAATDTDAQARELASDAEQSGSLRHRALADHFMGCAAALGGERGRARELLQAALAAHAELGLERGAADSLQELALLAASAGDSARAARMAAAAVSARARLGCAPVASSAERLANARERSIERDGQATWDTAWSEGEELPLADADLIRPALTWSPRSS